MRGLGAWGARPAEMPIEQLTTLDQAAADVVAGKGESRGDVPLVRVLIHQNKAWKTMQNANDPARGIVREFREAHGFTGGVIIRTAAGGRPEADILSDLAAAVERRIGMRSVTSPRASLITTRRVEPR